MKPAIVLCLGNEILSDDSFGHKIACRLLDQYDFNGGAEIEFAALGGLNLIDLLKDRERALIVDTIITGDAAPGTLHFIEMGHFVPSKNLTCSHEVNLPTALQFGRELGMIMPDRIDVLAVEASDIVTLSEKLTPQVEGALNPAINRILNWIGFNGGQSVEIRQKNSYKEINNGNH
jgi:hydrogenase maturation protease